MKRTIEFTMLLALCGTLRVSGAGLSIPETWSTNGVAGWQKYDIVNETKGNLTNESNALKLAVNANDNQPPEDLVFYAGTNASGGAFTGNYIQQGVTEIRFRLFCGGPVAADGVNLLLWNRNRMWCYGISDVATGVWMTVSVPVAVPDVYSFSESNLWSLFESTLRDVTAIGVEIVQPPNGNKAVVYRLDDVELRGVGPDFAATMEALTNYPGYGTGDRSVMSGADLDGDGSRNVDEWVAGTSAANPNDRFRVSIGQGPDKAARLSWASAAGRKYQVWSTEDLAAGFMPVSPKLDAPTNSYDVTGSNGTIKAFYRITVEKPAP